MSEFYGGAIGSFTGTPVYESSMLRPLDTMVGIDPASGLDGRSHAVLFVGSAAWFACRMDIAADRREIFNRLRDDLGLPRK